VRGILAAAGISLVVFGVSVAATAALVWCATVIGSRREL
jgi:hypothetical protein